MSWRIYRGSPGLWRPRGLWGAEERGWWLLIKRQGTSRRAFWRRCSDSNCKPKIGFKGEGVRRSREQVLRERQGWVRGFLKSLYKRKVGTQHLRGGEWPISASRQRNQFHQDQLPPGVLGLPQQRTADFKDNSTNLLSPGAGDVKCRCGLGQPPPPAPRSSRTDSSLASFGSRDPRHALARGCTAIISAVFSGSFPGLSLPSRFLSLIADTHHWICAPQTSRMISSRDS